MTFTLRERLLGLVRVRVDGSWYRLTRRRPGFYLPVHRYGWMPQRLQRIVKRIDRKHPWCWWQCNMKRPDTHLEPTTTSHRHRLLERP